MMCTTSAALDFFLFFLSSQASRPRPFPSLPFSPPLLSPWPKVKPCQISDLDALVNGDFAAYHASFLSPPPPCCNSM
ncbi:hypothetical protein GGR50DRAFT_637668 [Xylaria sp. CBS 124048]|nr:hypothetical protein GGR50DRAFT_637668 [Xylaria sp. CBS 124048]